MRGANCWREPRVYFEEGIAKTIEFFRGRVAAGDSVA